MSSAATLIEQSDAFLAKLTELIAQERVRCGPMGMTRALAKAANVCLQLIEPKQQKMALQLSKSELEFGIEEAGGLVETLKGVIKEQGMKIALLEMVKAAHEQEVKDDNRLQ
jgi:hypothetical protein